MFLAVLRIHISTSFWASWIRVRIHWLDPDPLVKGMDPDPAPAPDPAPDLDHAKTVRITLIPTIL
jgi:hypothetical protein